jgi:hypothetical protein
MVYISTVYLFTVFIYFNLEFSGEEIKVKVFMWETWDKRFESRKFFFCSIFRDITFLASLRFLQYHGSRFYATYHSSSSRQNILSISYRRNTKVQTELRFYRGFRGIDSSKLIYKLTIRTITSTSLSDPDSQSNKGNYKGKSCLIQLLFGWLLWWCVIAIFEKSFCLIAQRYLFF